VQASRKLGARAAGRRFAALASVVFGRQVKHLLQENSVKIPRHKFSMACPLIFGRPENTRFLAANRCVNFDARWLALFRFFPIPTDLFNFWMSCQKVRGQDILGNRIC
jgi:hypothetical protein